MTWKQFKEEVELRMEEAGIPPECPVAEIGTDGSFDDTRFFLCFGDYILELEAPSK